jgi:hypothetical protein
MSIKPEGMTNGKRDAKATFTYYDVMEVFKQRTMAS